MRKRVYQDREIILEVIQEEEESQNLVIIGNGNIMDWRRPMKRQEPLFENCTVLAMYFNSHCSGLRPAGKSLAEYLDTNPLARQYKNIFLVMHSKCGVMAITSVAEFLRRAATIFTISTPFRGTISATPEEMKRAIFREDSFCSPFKKRCNYMIYDLEYFSYRYVVFRNYPIDRNISVYSCYFTDHYKKEFLSRHNHINIVATCKNLSEEEWRRRGKADYFMYWLDKRLNIHGDGVVSTYSQSYFEADYELDSLHTTSLKDSKSIIQEYINEHIY